MESEKAAGNAKLSALLSAVAEVHADEFMTAEDVPFEPYGAVVMLFGHDDNNAPGAVSSGCIIAAPSDAERARVIRLALQLLEKAAGQVIVSSAIPAPDRLQ